MHPQFWHIPHTVKFFIIAYQLKECVGFVCRVNAIDKEEPIYRVSTLPDRSGLNAAMFESMECAQLALDSIALGLARHCKIIEISVP